MIPEAPRAPTEREIDLLRFLLSAPADGADAELLGHFRSQLDSVTVATDCSCGCESFTIYVDGGHPRTTNGPGPSAWNDSNAIELSLFISEGQMQSVEITYYDHDRMAPAGVPALDGFRLN